MEFITEPQRIVLKDNNKEIGEITWSQAGNQLMIVDHTVVDEKYTGQGLARQLVNHMVDYAREYHQKVLPLCPFTHSIFLKDPDRYRDIWDQR